jgi:hypothetical protein
MKRNELTVVPNGCLFRSEIPKSIVTLSRPEGVALSAGMSEFDTYELAILCD